MAIHEAVQVRSPRPCCVRDIRWLRGHTHYWWAAAFDIADVDPEAVEISRRNVTQAFDEDKHILERMQAQLQLDPRGAEAPEIGLAADGAGLRVRQVLGRRLEAEGRTLA